MEKTPGQDALLQIIDTMADPIFVKDRQHRMILVNDAFCEFYKRSRRECIGRTMAEYFLPSQTDVMWANDERVFLTGKEDVSEANVRDGEGAEHIITTKKTFYRDANGNEMVIGVFLDVTEQKLTERRLAQSEQRYRSLFANMKQGLIYCRILFQEGKPYDWIYLEANEAFTKRIGIKNIVGLKISERFPDFRETDPQILEHYGRVALSGQAERFETFMHASQTWFSISVYSPAPEYIVAVLDVIDERKRTEEALRQSEHRYRSLFTNLMQGLIYCRILLQDGRACDWIYLEANEAFTAFTGLKDVTGRRISELIPGFVQSEPELVERYGRVALTGRPERFEIYIHSTKSRSSISVYSPQPEHFVAVTEPITERKLAEEQLRKLSRAVEQSPVSIIITDPAGKIEYVNPKFTSVTGYTFAEVVDTNPSLLESEVNGTQSSKKPWDTVLGGQEWHGELCNKKKNGELFWESVSISPITGQHGEITHFLAVKEDITAHKQLEDQFRQAQKMEAFGRLAAGVAHDFNNMLTSILGNAELLAAGNPLDVYQQEARKEVVKGAERAAALTRQLLMFSRWQAVQLKVLEVAEVVENMSKMLRRLIGEDIALKTHHAKGGTPALADSGMLEQVLMNLAVNSRDAMPKGGELIIKTDTVDIVKPAGRQQRGCFIRLSVSDTGSGIAPQNMEHIFEPFFTTKEVGKGTGLGLATVFGIIEQHHGWIDVESQVGSGTTFHIYLPRHTAPANTEIRRRSKARERGGTETILLVEDDDSVRALARGLLSRYGYNVIEAGSGPIALEIWKEQQDRIDLLLTDMVMPGQMSGLALSQQLLKDKPGLKVIFSSGYTDEMLDEGSALRQAPNFLEKPFSPNALLRTIRTALD
jgi:two-component system NtrC family sensor kinase